MELKKRLENALGYAAVAARIVETAEEELYAEEAAGNARQCDYLRDKIDRWRETERTWTAGADRAANEIANGRPLDARDKTPDAEGQAHASEATRQWIVKFRAYRTNEGIRYLAEEAAYAEDAERERIGWERASRAVQAHAYRQTAAYRDQIQSEAYALDSLRDDVYSASVV